ncbi:hypothetical protein [Tenggerimyces flavus]|uniref:Uncharacterized protein n=1 Tax=Tenggerimyces flavus TaxID=1708749 RepID=A0ABV7YE47_9ACTN|nr:hypothetical protein [Tenggerimyces flavus]MBM7783431.1 hypothetical protein [Tenggerimyces flavus]
MISTTIKVPKSTRDRLHQLAARDGLTLAQEIEKLIDKNEPQPLPRLGGFRSARSLTAEEMDAKLREGFGR